MLTMITLALVFCSVNLMSSLMLVEPQQKDPKKVSYQLKG